MANQTPDVKTIAQFRIATMDCAAEESEIRRALEAFSAVRSLNFQFGSRTLAIDIAAEALPDVLKAIRNAGFDPQPVEAKSDDHGSEESGNLTRMAAALVLAIGAESISFFAPDTPAWKFVGMAIALVAIGLAGLSTYKKGWFALTRGKLNINALMTVAVTGAFVIGQWPEAAMVMALYAIAELIEAKAIDRARNAIKGLLALAPETAEVQVNGSWQSMAVTAVALKSVVRIKPGERVPMDGLIIKGNSAINQAPVTGESIAVDKVAGDQVFAGAINETGALEIARIIHAVEQAQSTRASTQRFVDRFAAIYTPTVFAIALAVAILMPLVSGR